MTEISQSSQPEFPIGSNDIPIMEHTGKKHGYCLGSIGTVIKLNILGLPETISCNKCQKPGMIDWAQVYKNRMKKK